MAKRQTYADLLKEEAERRLTQQTELTRSSIAPQRQATEGILGQSRQKALGNVQGIIGQAGSQYGVAPSAVQAGTEEFSGRGVRGLERQSAETLDRSRLNQMRTYFNQVFNVALTQYQQAGYSLEQSNEFARQYALDETDRAFGSEQAQKGREFELEKEGIREDISKRGAEFEEGLDTGNPYMQAFIQSLSGLAGAGLTYGIATSGKGKGKGTTLNLPNVAGVGGYPDYENYNANLSPYTRSGTGGTAGVGVYETPSYGHNQYPFGRKLKYQYGGTRGTRGV